MPPKSPMLHRRSPAWQRRIMGRNVDAYKKLFFVAMIIAFDFGLFAAGAKWVL